MCEKKKKKLSQKSGPFDKLKIKNEPNLHKNEGPRPMKLSFIFISNPMGLSQYTEQWWLIYYVTIHSILSIIQCTYQIICKKMVVIIHKNTSNSNLFKRYIHTHTPSCDTAHRKSKQQQDKMSRYQNIKYQSNWHQNETKKKTLKKHTVYIINNLLYIMDHISKPNNFRSNNSIFFFQFLFKCSSFYILLIVLV